MVLEQALSAVCNELEKHDPVAPCLHFARGLLASSAATAFAPPLPVAANVTLEATAKAFGFSVDDLQSSRRPQALAEARFAAMLVLRRQGVSLPKIGALLLRDHTTVIHGIERAEALESSSERYRTAVTAIMAGNVSGVIVAAPPSEAGDGRRKHHDKYSAIAAAYSSGKAVLQCAQEFGVSGSVVIKALHSEGVQMRPKGGGIRAVDPQRIARIMGLRAEGKTGEEIGRELGITRERVRQIVLKAGKREEFEARPFKSDEIAILEEYRAGQSLDYVAGKLGVSPTTARKHLTRYGLPIRPSRRRAEAKQRTRALAEQIAARYHAGDSIADIARDAGWHKPEQIYRYLAIAGVKPDRQSRFWLKQQVAA